MTLSTLSITNQRSFGGLVFDATFEEAHTTENVITDEPIELGGEINDHAYFRPRVVVISAGVSDYPLGDFAGNFISEITSTSRSASVYEMLLIMQRTQQLIIIQTGLIRYQNMLIQSIETAQDKYSENVLLFRATCKEINLVQLQQTTVPKQFIQSGKAANQASPIVDKGTQPGTQPSDQQGSDAQSSTLYNLFGK